MKLSSNLVGHTPHSYHMLSLYLLTFVTIGQKRYQRVTRGYCNQVIDLLSVYFLKPVECSPSDTSSTHRHISGSCSTIFFNAFCSLLFNHLLHVT